MTLTEPTTRDVAEELGVDEGQLREFVQFHRNVSPGAVLAFAGAGEEYRDHVDEWLDRVVEGYTGGHE